MASWRWLIARRCAFKFLASRATATLREFCHYLCDDWQSEFTAQQETPHSDIAAISEPIVRANCWVAVVIFFDPTGIRQAQVHVPVHDGVYSHIHPYIFMPAVKALASYSGASQFQRMLATPKNPSLAKSALNSEFTHQVGTKIPSWLVGTSNQELVCLFLLVDYGVVAWN